MANLVVLKHKDSGKRSVIAERFVEKAESVGYVRVDREDLKADERSTLLDEVEPTDEEREATARLYG